jgi:hypothetical protein
VCDGELCQVIWVFESAKLDFFRAAYFAISSDSFYAQSLQMFNHTLLCSVFHISNFTISIYCNLPGCLVPCFFCVALFSLKRLSAYFVRKIQIEQNLGVEVLCLYLEVFYFLSTGGVKLKLDMFMH